MDKQQYHDPHLGEPDWEDYSYADQEFIDEDDLPRISNNTRSKSAERKRQEAEFLALYNAYMTHSDKLSAFRIQCLQDDLYTLLYQLSRGWAHRKALRYVAAGFNANAEDALVIGCYYAHSKLLEDKAAGRYLDYPVAYYQRLAQNKAIDGYFRAEFGRLSPKKGKGQPDPADVYTEDVHRRKEPYFISIDGMNRDSDGNYHSDRSRELSYDPFADIRRPEQERRELASEIYGIFIRELLNYSQEPQKPLAVMYGNILFQLAKIRGSDDLSLAARASQKVQSPAWAHARMGNRTLVELGDFSEEVLSRSFRKPMYWGAGFRHHMQQYSSVPNVLWGDIVYTETYSERQTSDWLESISKTIIQRCAHQVVRDQEKREFVEETFSYRNKFRKALAKIEKEG